MYWQKLKTGKVRFFESYHDLQTGKLKYVSVTKDRLSNATKKQAQKELAALAALKMIPKQTSYTLSEVIDAYLLDLKQIARPATVETQTSQLKTVLSIIGNKPIEELNPIIVGQLFALDSRSASAKRKLLQYFKHMLRWSVGVGFLSSGSWISDIPPIRVSTDEANVDITQKYLEPVECRRLLDSIDDIYYRKLTAFLILSGCRLGEAVAVTVDDVNLENREISIDKSISESEVVGPTKTPSSVRRLYMQDELLDVVQSALKLGAGCQEGWLFVNRSGIRIRRHTYRIHLRAGLEAAGISKNITPHSLRHTHASLLYAAGVDKDIIARRLGHAPGREDDITLKIYTHITKQREDLDRNEIAKMSVF